MKNYLLNINKKIKDSLFQLEQNNEKCLVIVDSKYKLKGTLTDGDVRRALLRGASINSKLNKYIKKKPFSLQEKDFSKKNFIKKLDLRTIENLKDDHIDVVPLVNKNNKVIKILYPKDFKKYFSKEKILKNIPALIMAGGKGERLKQFTNYFPKPLVPVEDTTASEYIIDSFKKHGVKKFFMSLNYKKNLIKSYFNEDKINNISFLEEKKVLGTAGSISMLKNKVKSDFFVINCDTILSMNLEKFYDYHKKNNYKITLVAASKDFQLSYGSCEIKRNGELRKISEKPSTNYLVSVGLYLFKPEVINLVPKNKFFEMDVLIKKVKQRGGKIGVFPISEENWHDTGQTNEKERYK
tara:strand:- start:158 stop:1216 length:1059 start_codon:yes stop_codon:yes gene_type:complete